MDFGPPNAVVDSAPRTIVLGGEKGRRRPKQARLAFSHDAKKITEGRNSDWPKVKTFMPRSNMCRSAPGAVRSTIMRRRRGFGPWRRARIRRGFVVHHETTGSGGAQGSHIRVTQLAVFIMAARSASTIKSRVIGTAARLIDSSI